MIQRCFLNGDFVSLERACLSPLDRGFLFGDAIYEVIKIREGVPLWLNEHLARLERNLEEVGITHDLDLKYFINIYLKKEGLKFGSLYIQISRGTDRFREHLPSKRLLPTVFMLLSDAVPASLPSDPLKVIPIDDFRWGRCDIKVTSLAANVLAKIKAQKEGFDEVVFVSSRGEVREGGSSSVFVKIGGIWFTHPLDNHILPGITREKILKIFRDKGIEYIERPALIKDIESWEEICVCGTLTGVAPVARFGEVKFSLPFEEVIRIANAYDELERNYVDSFSW